jgi:hypothetical protein
VILVSFLYIYNKCGSSVSIALGYGLDESSRVRFPLGAGYFSLHHRVQNDSGVHPTSYPGGTGVPFPEDKAAGFVKLTTPLRLVPMLRMRGAIPPLLHTYLGAVLT